MKTKVTLVAKTTEVEQVCTNDANQINEESILLAGKAAGICYMPDDYLSVGVQNEEKCIARANNNKQSGHHSTYEHSQLTFIIQTSKIMCIILNSINTYATSEKSGRWTKMTGNSEIETEKYNKWVNNFKQIIAGYYKDSRKESEIEKLAMENARYMLDIFYPTTLEYSIRYKDLSYLIVHLEKLVKDFDRKTINRAVEKRNFIKRLIEEIKDLILAFEEAVFVDRTYLLDDPKDSCIRILDNLTDESFDSSDYKTEIANSYSLRYKGSFAMIAQSQRHRSLRYSILNINFKEYYIPAIIRNTPYEIEWIKDLQELSSNELIPCATLLDIYEQGIVDDYILKIKERLCNRAQLEICEVEQQNTIMFALYAHNISNKKFNKILSEIVIPKENIFKSRVLPRCAIPGYVCHEPCKYGKNGLIRNI